MYRMVHARRTMQRPRTHTGIPTRLDSASRATPPSTHRRKRSPIASLRRNSAASRRERRRINLRRLTIYRRHTHTLTISRFKTSPRYAFMHAAAEYVKKCNRGKLFRFITHLSGKDAILLLKNINN